MESEGIQYSAVMVFIHFRRCRWASASNLHHSFIKTSQIPLGSSNEDSSTKSSSNIPAGLSTFDQAPAFVNRDLGSYRNVGILTSNSLFQWNRRISSS